MRDKGALRTMVFDSLEEQIAVIDGSGNIVDVNQSWTEFGIRNGVAPGYSSVGSNYLEVLRSSAASGDDLAGAATDGLLAVLAGNRDVFYYEYPCHTQDQMRWFMMRVTPLKGSNGKLFVISHLNITERKLAEERAEFLSRHDPLTGLANRRFFNEALSSEMRRCIRSGSELSLIEIDVDRFKAYNDENGHTAGDRCLVEISKVLRRFTHRPGDLAARLGGDEFGLVLANMSATATRELAGQIRRAVNELGFTYSGTGRVTISLGAVTLIPRKHEAEALILEEADKALYRAKLAGGDCVVHDQRPVAARAST